MCLGLLSCSLEDLDVDEMEYICFLSLLSWKEAKKGLNMILMKAKELQKVNVLGIKH